MSSGECCEHCMGALNRTTDLEREAEKVRLLFNELDNVLDGLVYRIQALEARRDG